jgi:hypothetical protein
MPRLILISKTIDSQIISLANSMVSQYEILVLTSRSQDTSQLNANIKAYCYFKNWSTLEACKLMPMLLHHESQIWHFWHPNSSENKVSPALIALSVFAKAQLNDRIAISLHPMREKPHWSQALPYLMKLSDALLASDYEELRKTRGVLLSARRKAVLPPLISLKPLNNASAVTITGLTSYERVIVIPTSPQHFFKNPKSIEVCSQALKDKSAVMVFAHEELLHNSRSRRVLEQKLQKYVWYSQICFAPQTVDTLLNALAISKAKQEQVLWLAGLRFTDIELYHFLALSIEFKAPLVLDAAQVDSSSFVWQRRKNCWVLPQNLAKSELNQLFSQDTLMLPILEEQTSNSLFEQLRDKSINELNRLYSQLLYSQTEVNVR